MARAFPDYMLGLGFELFRYLHRSEPIGSRFFTPALLSSLSGYMESIVTGTRPFTVNAFTCRPLVLLTGVIMNPDYPVYDMARSTDSSLFRITLRMTQTRSIMTIPKADLAPLVRLLDITTEAFKELGSTTWLVTNLGVRHVSPFDSRAVESYLGILSANRRELTVLTAFGALSTSHLILMATNLDPTCHTFSVNRVKTLLRVAGTWPEALTEDAMMDVVVSKCSILAMMICILRQPTPVMLEQLEAICEDDLLLGELIDALCLQGSFIAYRSNPAYVGLGFTHQTDCAQLLVVMLSFPHLRARLPQRLFALRKFVPLIRFLRTDVPDITSGPRAAHPASCEKIQSLLQAQYIILMTLGGGGPGGAEALALYKSRSKAQTFQVTELSVPAKDTWAILIYLRSFTMVLIDEYGQERSAVYTRYAQKAGARPSQLCECFMSNLSCLNRVLDTHGRSCMTVNPLLASSLVDAIRDIKHIHRVFSIGGRASDPRLSPTQRRRVSDRLKALGIDPSMTPEQLRSFNTGFSRQAREVVALADRLVRKLKGLVLDSLKTGGQ